MANAGYLFAAYSIIWVVVFGYVLTMFFRQRKISRDIETLKQTRENKAAKS
jgi:CcmD family protein